MGPVPNPSSAPVRAAAEEWAKMNAREHRTCEWLVTGERQDSVAVCGRPPLGVVLDTFGARHFACRDHLSLVKARFGTGAWTSEVARPPVRPYPEALL
ncbi:MAG: hypothetical protein L3K00_05605 [Thermoplasmata archaeon]|nr:hypothetical protein [Thermoplasmata archaeon]